MKIYISADIEGIGCVVRSEHSSPQGREYAFARKQMTAEVNAAIQGAIDSGATDVVVADAHNVGLNLIPDELDERACLIMGSPRPLSMMEGIQEGFDAALFVGYHAMAGTYDSSIVHVFTGRIAELKMNGQTMGEIGLNAGLAGYYNVPVALVTGDDKTCAEAEALLPGVETVAVKRGIGAYASLCLHPGKTRELIYQAAKEAVAKTGILTPVGYNDQPVTMELRFTTASAVDRVMRMPRVKRLDNLTVRFVGDNYIEAFQAFNVMADLVELVPFI